MNPQPDASHPAMPPSATALRDDKTFAAILELSASLFAPDTLARLLGECIEPVAPGSVSHEFLTRPDEIAAAWLATGGKRLRPFLTLATYLAAHPDSLKGKRPPGAAELAERVPESVCRVALAMEILHKASLIHDDIEDADLFRYGEATLHRTHGVPFAINTGDLLVALGYRLVAQEAPALGSRCIADILAVLGDCHMRLCRGQGAELLWTQSERQAEMLPTDALALYAAKTAPAFEIALYAGLRMADLALAPSMLRAYARALGVAFQIQNDLEDWQALADRHVTGGRDQLAGRPTLLHLLAFETASKRERAVLTTHPAADADDQTAAYYLRSVADIFTAHDVFRRARGCAEREQHRAEALAHEITPDPLSLLLVTLAAIIVPRQ